jgi:hypothetical protein
MKPFQAVNTLHHSLGLLAFLPLALLAVAVLGVNFLDNWLRMKQEDDLQLCQSTFHLFQRSFCIGAAFTSKTLSGHTNQHQSDSQAWCPPLHRSSTAITAALRRNESKDENCKKK